MIPLCDLTLQYQSLQPEIDAALLDAVRQAKYILGPNVKAFESEVAAYCGTKHAVGVGNGTDALTLALRALRIGPGDEVITTPFTFVATAEAVSLVGATPVFVDIDPQTFNIDPKQIAPAITPRTRAIIVVHLYGQACEMDPIMQIAEAHGLKIVEDCAQAMGAEYKGRKVGSFGDAGCLSFFPSKNLGCFGDGGMVVTNDQEVFERVEMLRRHGGRVKYYHDEVGTNSRLDEVQAAILRVKLPHLDNWNTARRAAACRYNALLADIAPITCPAERRATGYGIPRPGDENGLLRAVYHQYTALAPDREAVMAQLQKDGVGCLVYYPVPLHLQTVYKDLGYTPGDLPKAEFAARHCFSLPMFPELTEAQQRQVAETLRKACAGQQWQKSRAA